MKIKPYLVLLIISVLSGLILKIDFSETLKLILEGFKNIIFSIGPIIIIGTILESFFKKQVQLIKWLQRLLKYLDYQRFL